MMPNFDAWGEFFKFQGALSILTSVSAIGMAWYHHSSPEGDEVISKATDELIEGLSDADKVGKIKDETWNDIRDQVSIEQVEKWREDQEFLKNKRRN